MGVQVQVTVQNNVGGVLSQIMAGLVAGENAGASYLLQEALDVVPRDTNTLANSGRVVRATDPETGAAVVFDTRYAAIVHERFKKYPEDPAMSGKGEIGEIISEQVQGA